MQGNKTRLKTLALEIFDLHVWNQECKQSMQLFSSIGAHQNISCRYPVHFGDLSSFELQKFFNFNIWMFQYYHTATKKNHWQCLVAINGDGKAYYELLPLQQLNQNWLKRGQRGPEAQRPDITRYLFDQRKWKKQEAQRPRGPRYPKGPKHTETPLTRCYHNEDLIPTELSNTTLDLRGPEA